MTIEQQTADRRSLGAQRAAERNRAFHPQVHALRAIAVSMVLLYHLWPARYTGGFIGVDVFLVLSGFLITAHIWRQRDLGWGMLPRFWARRVLRLAPAALTIVVATGALVAAFVPQIFWERYAREAIASVLISVNFVLFGDSVDYLAADNAPTPFQHYWSLSVEEQFYILWPVLVIVASLLAVRVARGAKRVRPEAVAFAVVAAVSVLSFAVSIVVLPVSPSAAYFMMPLRIWEFGFGAALALAMPWLQTLPGLLAPAGQRALRSAARIIVPLAYAALIVNGWLLSGSAPFPGWNALLPVAIATLVIGLHPFAEFAQRGPWSRLEQGPVVRFLGDVSYSAYLWHWPLIILAPFVLGRELDLRVKLVILVATLVLAWATTRWIETPLRTLPRWQWRVARRRLVLIAAWAAVAVSAWGTAYWVGSQYEGAEFSEVETSAECFGATTVLNPEACGPLPGEPATEEALLEASAGIPAPWNEGCVAPFNGPEAPHCEYLFGADESSPAIVLWGDSHAGAWSPAFEEAAREMGLNLYTFSRDGCPPAMESPIATIGREIGADEQQNCADRNAEVLEFVETHPNVVGVFASSLSTNYVFADDAPFGGIDEALTSLATPDRAVALLADVPLTGDAYGDRVNVAECLAANTADVSACDNTRERALNTAALREFVADRAGDAVTIIDGEQNFCDADTCYAVVGGVPVFFDRTHLPDAFSRSLSTWLQSEIEPLLDVS